MADVHIKNVTKSYGDTVAVDGLDLHIADGEFVVLLGPTGAGKTTTLRLIAGLERPDAGTIEIGGHDATALSPAERDTAFVFQQYSLYPHLSVFDNLAFPLRSPARKTGEDQIRRRVEEVARMVRIDHKLANRSTKLSGGEMQRVAIGRALVRKPAIYLMDEPLSSLDAKLRADLRLELKRIQAELGATMLYVTHDQIEAMTMADRIGILADGVRAGAIDATSDGSGADAALVPGLATQIGLPDDPTGSVAVRAIHAWSSLFGLLTFELFGHAHNVVADHERLFADAVERIGTQAGLPT